ncbi:MAG TPA: lysylphosphatidylglycerol synthase transmembrane domain-containing protein [Chloroflexota bacterium]|nr:lysylphosphatidylglycerol synthase transmembrane domain-containing protein [Chloroflexota bacterium]
MTSLRTLYRNRWFRYALTVVLLALVALKVQPGKITEAAGSARPEDLTAALALTVPFLLLKALRWYAMLRAASIEAGFSEAAYSLIGGMGLALITPARLGELVRAAYLRDRQKWKIGGLVLVDKGFDVLVLAGLSVPGAAVLLGIVPAVALAAATAAGLLVVYNPVRVAGLLSRATTRLPARRQLLEAFSSLESLGSRPTSEFLALTLVAFAVVLLQFGIILLSWHSWSPEIVLLTFPMVILTNVLPLTVGGLGIREGAAALLLAHFGVSAADAALAAFLMFVINTALPGVIGALFLPAPSGAARTAGIQRP